MAKVGNKWNIEVTEIKQMGIEPSEVTGLHTYVVSGIATSEDGDVHHFAAQNNLDRRYADRFKVNWNGKSPRMPKEVGHGIDDEAKKLSANGVTPSLYMGRGARIAIARMCKELLGKHLSTAGGRALVAAAFKELDEEGENAIVPADS